MGASGGQQPHWRGVARALGSLVLGTGLALAGSTGASAADLAEANKLFRTGRYDECAKLAGEEIAQGPRGEEWWHLKVKAEAARGRFADAVKSFEGVLDRFPTSMPLLLVGHDLYRRTGRDKQAAAALEAIEKRVRNAPGRDLSPAERVALGRFFLLRGVDARKVLDQFFADTTKKHPDFIEAWFASAELALDKHDHALAADTLQKAPKEAAQDPRYHYLLARAFAADDRARSAKALAEAMEINPRHVDSLLLRADQLIDAEDYAAAEKLLTLALDVDPGEPRAWAYRAVLAHLRGDFAGEAADRKKALARWAGNPEVDHLIGRKLSQDYRFAEGAAYQRKALALDADYAPARLQLCQDLLRLGQEEEGWKLAADIFAKDGYNVVTYNLVTLRDNLARYRSLRGDGFIVRMEAREADLYGRRALALLQRARQTLGDKYGVQLDREVTVEIFPRKQDFAVRTFGLPGADGFLGVCFGPVITANSPASQGAEPANWEAVLWHEFCHTVTLHKTRNRMPRWLSEGISVYEELQENPAWGQWLTPRYREMILGEDLTPLSQLSSAFLAPKSAVHVRFAYYESALAIEFVVQRYGFAALKAVLDDLGAGLPIQEALVRRTTALPKLDAEFAEFARKRARGVAPGATWEKPDLPPNADAAAVTAWLKKHPRSFWGLQLLGAKLVHEKKWQQAEKTLKELHALYPEYVGPENAYELLAAVYRHRSNAAQERATLEELAKRDGDASRAYVRLMELGEAAGDWPAVARNARRLLAVNPLVPAPHRALARAAEKLGEREEALAAYRAMLQLGDPDVATIHYRLAVLLRDSGELKQARREVLKALEEAPRFREAQRLLLELVAKDPERPRTPEKKP